ncbi:hypothetical protein MJO28_011157 [Puccinia striiformis f. sp. tritici]|uniref:Uncharacterized protein n=1 Tax=Puccinia striiformis f. sp. tritici TaxID=168172 RepID=A0ACC0E2X8_9BASI|nr:hypothetical protein MJO28_011157 [Puccinia striiformis f. sp. tritici]KAI7946421.1 hypothetical protein MJO29_010948 [Puccinia striiformis f. sp. tritici]
MTSKFYWLFSTVYLQFGSITMASPSDPSLLSNSSLPPTETASDAKEDTVNVQGGASSSNHHFRAPRNA